MNYHLFVLTLRTIITATAISITVIQVTHASETTNEQTRELIQQIQNARSIESGLFTRLDKDILKFEGRISRDSYSKYLKAIDDNVTTMIINSPGGNTYDGVQIGLDMLKRSLTVIVDGVAGSSAANYLFTAGKKKIIRNGFVGFHGNAQAADRKRNLREELMASLGRSGAKLSQEQIEAIIAETGAIVAKTIQLEKQFFSQLGISQDFFDLTQEDGKGLPEHLRMNFEFLLPSITTMERFGIRNVTGRQDIETAEKMMKVIYY